MNMNAHRQQNQNALFAALDLGSNSFHLVLAEHKGDSFEIVETLKEKVQLLAGCKDDMIAEDAFERARQCLRRFKQRLSPIQPDRIHVRGTQALRQAKNAEPFLQDITEILGSAVKVTSGDEEAALVYQAVLHGTSWHQQAKFVIDVGGGSTEIAIGTNEDPDRTISLPLGCVSLTDQYLSDVGQGVGYVAAKLAFTSALSEALSAQPDFAQAVRNSVVVGTSGTVESVNTVLKSNGWTTDAITAEGVLELEESIVSEQWFVEAGLPGLSPDRVDIFTAGAAIVCGCFETLGLTEMSYADVSLPHGVLFEAIGAREHPWSAQDSIQRLATKFEVDLPQAERVKRQCARLFQETSENWWGDDPECSRLLDWAAHLHEIGRGVSGSHYHRHGAYIIKNSEIRGLNTTQQTILALLVRGHRRSLPRLAFQAFDPGMVGMLTRLVSILRIAVILERSHFDADSPSYEVECCDDNIEIRFKDQWLAEHPLSRKELDIETVQLAESGIGLTFSD